MSQLPTHCAPLYGEAGICPGCAIALLQIINGLDAALKAALAPHGAEQRIAAAYPGGLAQQFGQQPQFAPGQR